MKVAVDAGQLADLARAEAERHAARTPERRAAAHLHTCLTTSATVSAARNAITTFGEPATHADALALLGRLITTTAKGTTA